MGRPTEDNDRLMEVVMECAELANAEQLEKAFKDITLAINRIWIHEKTPLYAVIPMLQVVLAHLCDEWDGYIDEDDGENDEIPVREDIPLGPAEEVLKMLLSRFREKRVAQVEGYNKFGYIRETNNAVIVSRESGKDTPVPFSKIKLAIEAVRKDPQVYDEGPSRLKIHGITHINSPIWAILHLAELSEILE